MALNVGAVSFIQPYLNIKPIFVLGPAFPTCLSLGLDFTSGPAFITWTFSFFQESQWNELLETLHRLPIPDPGVSVHLSVVSGARWWPPQTSMSVWTFRGDQNHTLLFNPSPGILPLSEIH